VAERGNHAVRSRTMPNARVGIMRYHLWAYQNVDAAFARDEGEGDLSLEYWREDKSAVFLEDAA
jgi:uncharacterized protein YhfF